jgi:hypothetical protein
MSKISASDDEAAGIPGMLQGTVSWEFVLISLLGVGPMVPHFLVQGHFLQSKKPLCRRK